MSHRLFGTLLGLVLLTGSQSSCSDDSSHDEFAAALLAELVAANTAPSGGNDMRPAVALLVRHLKDAGFSDDDIFAQGQSEKLQNLVVRLRSKSPAQKPLLLMAHMDVVAESVKACYDARDEARGLGMVYEPKYLRFFQARFKPL